jgi:hypothetical protein
VQLAPESGQPLGARAVANQAADLEAIGTKPLGKPTADESGPSAEKSFHTDPYGARLRRAQTTGEGRACDRMNAWYQRWYPKAAAA